MSGPDRDVDERAETPTDALTPQSVALATGVRLEYVERGDSTGVPVLLLHGFTDSWRAFEPLLRHLPASIRAFAVTQRGHGESDRPAAGYGPRDFAADLAAFMDAFALARAVIVGHSLGTIVAQRFVLDYPARTLGLVLVNWRGRPRPSVVAAMASLTDPIDPGFVREFLVASFAQPPEESVLDAMLRESLKVPARVWRSVLEDVLADDTAAHLGRIAAPALVVWGAQDATSSRPAQEALATSLRDARLAVYPESGHSPHWEEPARFAAELAAFVARVAN
jgi:pimeloyl-ACP methyl ester carboxylesterase